MRLTTKLHLCYASLCPVAFDLSYGNFHGIHEGRKLIEYIYPKNNNYPLIDTVYEDSKTLALVKSHRFFIVVPPTKIRKSSWLCNKQFYKQRNIVERYFLRLKRFRKVFTCYDKLDSIFISAIFYLSRFYFRLAFYVNTI